nr:hypothetical protein [Acidobacteriota bacterium]
MIVVALQALATAVACIALFRLVRGATPEERWLRTIVIAGFVGRAVAGQALFWISWLHVPLLPELQHGNGIWFFGADGASYFREAVAALDRGFGAVVALNSRFASGIYIQLFAVAMWFFGRVTSSALLVNLLCHSGMVALLLRWRRREPRTRTSVAVAITAISLSPAIVLWSLQPLKDTPFQLLIVAFFCVCAAWQRAWSRPAPWLSRTGIAALLLLLLAMLSAVRWYFGLAVLGALLLFLLLVALRTPQRK